MKHFLRGAFAVVSLALLVYFVPMGQVLEVIQTASFEWLFLGLFLQFCVRFITAWRMALLARYQGLNLGFVPMLHILFSSSFYGFLLPGSVFGGAATYVKYRQWGGKAGSSFANIVSNKAMEVFSVTLLLMITSAFLYGTETVFDFAVIFAFLFVLFFRHFATAFGLLQMLERRAATARRAWLKRLGSLLSSLNLFQRFTDRQSVILIGLALVNQLVAAAAMMAYGHALGINGVVSWSFVIFMYACTYIGALLPVTVANFGVREAIMISLLTTLGIATFQSAAWSFCLYLGPLCVALVGLFLEVYRGPTTLSDEARRLP